MPVTWSLGLHVFSRSALACKFLVAHAIHAGFQSLIDSIRSRVESKVLCKLVSSYMYKPIRIHTFYVQPFSMATSRLSSGPDAFLPIQVGTNLTTFTLAFFSGKGHQQQEEGRPHNDGSARHAHQCLPQEEEGQPHNDHSAWHTHQCLQPKEEAILQTWACHPWWQAQSRQTRHN